jgi:hypothetical protein
VNAALKKARVAIFIFEKVNFKQKLVRENKEGHFILREGTILQKDITSINIYTPNIGIPNFIKEALVDIKSQADPNTIIMGDFNTPISPIHSSPTQNKKETSKLNDTMVQIDLTDI